MVTICKQFDFDAAHYLPHVADGHKCKRMHGHTYRVDVMLQGEPDARGMVVDYAEIAEAWGVIDSMLDHRVLNDVPGLENPTTENLAPWIMAHLAAHPLIPKAALVAVRVYESATTWCEVRRAV